MKKTLVLAGGGHAHMVCLANLDQFVSKGYQAIVIGPSAYHYYSGMGPGMLGAIYTPAEIRFATRHVVEKMGGRFVLGKVERIDAQAQQVHLESGESVAYDVLSCNLGSQVPRGLIQDGLEDVYLVKPIERLLEAQQRILTLGRQKKLRIGIVGGGPSAVEIAGNLWRLTQRGGAQPADIKIFCSSTLMPDHARGIRSRAEASLRKRGIEIVSQCRVQRIKSGVITASQGQSYDLDIIFVAIGVKPTPVFKNSGLPVGPDGGLLVNRFLHSPDHANIFGGGDCIYFQDQPLDKVGVFAVRQNPVLFHNLMATLDGTDLQAFDPGGKYLLIFNLGDGTGIFHKGFLQFGGRLAFHIKDYIDRKFMRRFQQIE